MKSARLAAPKQNRPMSGMAIKYLMAAQTFSLGSDITFFLQCTFGKQEGSWLIMPT